MIDDRLARLLRDAYTHRADTVETMRSENNPFKPAYQRPERKGQKAAHRDPTGNRAIGNIKREQKKQ